MIKVRYYIMIFLVFLDLSLLLNSCVLCWGIPVVYITINEGTWRSYTTSLLAEKAMC
jgi:hypothetical protein